jgi:hypothetical protein
MNKFLLGSVGLLISLSSAAQSIELPSIKAGDTWTYRITTEKGANGWAQSNEEVTVSHATASTIYYTEKQADSTQPAKERVSGVDWSRMRDVNGKETIVNKPFSFPLMVGKTWEIQYTEQHPNSGHRSERWDHKFTVTGFETIEVAAGKFNALKVEEEGHWSAETEPNNTIVQGVRTQQGDTTMVTKAKKTGSAEITGRTYKAFWYVPEVKRWVKSVEEYYGNDGTRNERYTGELLSFKLAE